MLAYSSIWSHSELVSYLNMICKQIHEMNLPIRLCMYCKCNNQWQSDFVRYEKDLSNFELYFLQNLVGKMTNQML